MTITTAERATPKQLAFLRVLMFERLNMDSDAIDKMGLERFTKSEASGLIDEWSKLERQRTAPKAMWETTAAEAIIAGAPATAAPAPAPAPSAATVAVPAARTWDCFNCKAVFPDWPSLSAHKPTCAGRAAPSAMKCYSCDDKFTTYAELMAHRATSHATAAAPSPTPTCTLDKGRYAVLIEGVWKFYRVTERDSRYGRGKYLHMTRQAGDNFVPVSKDERLQVETLVKIDVRRAMMEYGQRLGHCGCCGRALTDPQSRTLGIGPDCRAAKGW